MLPFSVNGLRRAHIAQLRASQFDRKWRAARRVVQGASSNGAGVTAPDLCGKACPVVAMTGPGPRRAVPKTAVASEQVLTGRALS